jgi:DNA replication protein DnaC
MLNHNTIESLRSLRLPAMASGLLTQREQPDYSSPSFEARLGLLVDAELLQRQNRRLERVFKAAKLAAGAAAEDVDYSNSRGLDKATFVSLVNSDWVEHHHNVIVLGQTGVGKTYLACALARTAQSFTATARSTCEPHGCSTTSPLREAMDESHE